jgi:nucleoside phosphorylase
MAQCAATTAIILAADQPDLIILAGIAGTYTDELSIGETVAVRSEVIADMGRRSGGEFTPLFQKTYSTSVIPAGYRAVPSNTVNCAGALVEQPTAAEIENMEGAAFFAVCEKFGVPAMEIRTVSNRVGEPITAEYLHVSITRLANELEKIIAKQ